jgi:hypothetical protein
MENNDILHFLNSKKRTSNSGNYFLHGYFQNKNYITDKYENELIEIFTNKDICYNLLTQYPNLNESYFIHIRRGDFLNNDMYNFDRDAYYKKAIDYICDIDKNTHFFILSDDIIYAKHYEILENINKTFIEGMGTLDCLYLMSLCRKGGICANSTFSGWATKLNKNKDKIVIFPKQYINIDYDYEIPFDYTIAL